VVCEQSVIKIKQQADDVITVIRGDRLRKTTSIGSRWMKMKKKTLFFIMQNTTQHNTNKVQSNMIMMIIISG